MGYAITISEPAARGTTRGQLTAVPELAAVLEMPETLTAAWLARPGVVLVCGAADAPRWQDLADRWHGDTVTELAVRVSPGPPASEIILPPAAAAVANFAGHGEILGAAVRGALLICRWMQMDYWEPRFLEFAAAVA